MVLLLQECTTWLNVAAAQEESGCPREDVDGSYAEATSCARESGRARLQVRVSGTPGCWTERRRSDPTVPSCRNAR